jgi:hypothetical protein
VDRPESSKLLVDEAGGEGKDPRASMRSTMCNSPVPKWGKYIRTITETQGESLAAVDG